MIKYDCPNCSTTITVTSTPKGSLAQCPKCKQRLRLLPPEEAIRLGWLSSPKLVFLSGLAGTVCAASMILVWVFVGRAPAGAEADTKVDTKVAQAGTADNTKEPSGSPKRDKEPEVKKPAAEVQDKGSEKVTVSVSLKQDVALSPAFTDSQLHERLLRSVVWIYGEDGQSAWTGSGGVIHVGQRLIITNHHVVANQRRVLVLFPQRDSQGQLISDKKYYEKLLKEGKGKSALVLRAEKDRDLAVIQLESPLPPDTLAIKVAPRVARPGERLVSVGNPGVSSGLWVLSTGSVRSRVPEIRVKVTAKNGQGEEEMKEVVYLPAQSLETTLPINKGDSGSPVVNDRGQLVAVNFAGNSEAHLMLFAVDRNEVLAVLEKVGVKKEEVVAAEALPPAGVVIQGLLKDLSEGALEQCGKAIESLSRLDPAEARRAIPALVQALQRHEDAAFRRRVAEELVRIGPPVVDDIDCLGAALAVPNVQVRLWVVNALGQLGDQARRAVPVLAQALKDADNEVRRKAARVLKDLGPAARTDAFQALLHLANDTDEEVAREGLNALVNLGPLTTAETDVLVEALGDAKRRTSVRQYVATQLGKQGSQAVKAVPVLIRVLQAETDLELLSCSVAALRGIGDTRTEVPAVLVGLFGSHPEEKIRLESLEALDTLGPTALSTGQLLERMGTEKSENLQQALAKRLATRLDSLKAEQLTELAPLLRHKETSVVKLGLKVVLGRTGEAAAMASDLATLVTHADLEVRRSASEVLEAMGPAAKAAVPALLRTLKDATREQRSGVALMLAAIDTKDPKVIEAVLPVLLTELRPHDSSNEVGATIRAKIDKVLVAIGQPAVDEIFKTFESLSYRGADNSNYRKYLFEALERLGRDCKSKQNYEQVKSLRDRELRERYADVVAAAQKALKEMDPR